MPDYQQGKIYVIRSRSQPDLAYVGSTTQDLDKRWRDHILTFESMGMGMDMSSKHVLQAGDAYIELYEMFPCETGEALRRREGEVQKAIPCVNVQVAGRTNAEYYQDNREVIREKGKAYYAEHKEERSKAAKAYYAEHKGKIIEYQRQYYKDQTQAIAQRGKAYAEAHKDELKACGKEWRQTHREEILAKKKAYYEANRDSFSEANRLYRESHKEEAAAYGRQYRERKRLEKAQASSSKSSS